MKHTSTSSLFALLAILSTACATSRPSTPGGLPSGAIPVGTPTPSTGPWAFHYAPGTRAYRISRNASIEGSADSASRREIVSNFTHHILTLDEVGGGDFAFKAVIDTFLVTTQGAVGPAQLSTLPIELLGSLGAGGVRLESPPSEECSPVRATAATDLYNLLPRFPSPLSRNATWKDSISTSACHAGIPTTVVTRRAFTVSGEVEHSGRRFLLVQRLDSMSARGEGAYNQHRMQIESTGIGAAAYYLDTASGEVAQMTTNQRSWIKVTTSGRLHTFTQVANQEFVRVR